MSSKLPLRRASGDADKLASLSQPSVGHSLDEHPSDAGPTDGRAAGILDELKQQRRRLIAIEALLNHLAADLKADTSNPSLRFLSEEPEWPRGDDEITDPIIHHSPGLPLP